MARTKRQEVKQAKPIYWNAALYIRLSREDGDKEESDSIGNQRDMLMAFLEENPDLKLYDTYVDDGFTGTNFKRPSFQRMIKDIEQQSVNCIIVKDLSRFGRDYIGVGNYQENFFPKYNIRFIALNDRIDTYQYHNDSDSIIVPFKNIFNEQYARDISHKVRSALDTKRKKGEFIGSFACYGYKKDENNHNKLVIDEEVADNVRLIYQWFIQGMPKLTIANKLNDLGIPCPSEYKRQKGMKYVNSNRLISTTYWTHTSIHRILKSEIYAGDMVQHTQTNKSFKNHKNIQLDKSDWIIVKNTHEPIIDRDTWETAQRLLGTDIKKSQYTGKIHLFAGLIKCADCGRAMKKRGDYYICGTYQAYGKQKCTNHSIRIDEVTDMVFSEIKLQINKYLHFQEIESDPIFQKRWKNISDETNKEIEKLRIKLDRSQNLNMGLYEDFKSGILSQNEYISFKAKYAEDIKNYESQIRNLEKQNQQTVTQKEHENSLAKVLKYKTITSLDRQTVVALIKNILVHDDKTVTIVLNFNPL